MENLISLKSIKLGVCFKRIVRGKLSEETYTRTHYDRSTKRFDCVKHSDAWGNGIQLKGSTLVSTQFEY